MKMFGPLDKYDKSDHISTMIWPVTNVFLKKSMIVAILYSPLQHLIKLATQIIV